MQGGSGGSSAAGGYSEDNESNKYYGETRVWNQKNLEAARRGSSDYDVNDSLEKAIQKEERRLGGSFGFHINADRDFVKGRAEFQKAKAEEDIMLATMAQDVAKENSAKVRVDTKATQKAVANSARLSGASLARPSGGRSRGSTILTSGGGLGGSDQGESTKKTLLGA